MKNNDNNLFFARYGGLSAVKYKPSSEPDFHTPPSKKGIYAFVYPYIENFLWCWNEKKAKNVREKKEHIRKFSYEGEIWCHFSDLFPNYPQKGSWVLVDFYEFKNAFKIIQHQDLQQMGNIFKSDKYKNVINPYKRGLNGGMGKDHLEIFIEAKHLGKIRALPVTENNQLNQYKLNRHKDKE